MSPRLQLKTLASDISAQSRSSSASASGSNAALDLSMYQALPKGTVSGNFVVTTHETLQSVGASKRLHNFINVGADPKEAVITRGTYMRIRRTAL